MQRNNFPSFNGLPIDTAIKNRSVSKQVVTQVEPTNLTIRNMPCAFMGWYGVISFYKVSNDSCKIAYCLN